jgi:predicted ATP-binding protein involved in virulence
LFVTSGCKENDLLKNKTMEIKEIHEAVFQFLLKKREADPTLRYNLRFKAGEKLNERHYWFHGSDTYNDLYLTFWDTRSIGSPTINFLIEQNGKTHLLIDERRGGRLTEIWQELAPTLKLERVTKAGNPIDYWLKHYPYQNQTYLESLDNFIKKERPYINSYFELMGCVDAYPPFAEYDFQRKLNKIENIRKGIQITKFKDFLDQKLRITCLQLTNINAFESINIRFEKRVTCFVGGNGSGKTTVLRGIALGLAGSKGFQAEDLPLLTIKAAKKDLRYQSEGIIDVFYDFKGSPFHNAVFFRSDKEAREFALADDEGTSLRDPSDAKRLETLIIGFSQQTQAGQESESKPNGSYGPKLTDLEALILNKTDNRYHDFIKWLNALITADAKEDRKENKMIIESIFKIINDITGDIIGLTSDTDTFVKTRQNKEGIPMKLLSQGYRNVLTWLGFFMKRMVEYKDSLSIEVPDFRELPAVCLIDEIDTYLHPDWQYSILSGLVENFPNVQFFITSHSPFVLTSVKSEDFAIFNLKKGEKEKIEVQEIEVNLYGADANRATAAISSERKVEIKVEFNELYRAIEANHLEKAQELLNKLEEMVDAHLDLGILNAKQLIRTKQLRQKAKQEGQK